MQGMAAIRFSGFQSITRSWAIGSMVLLLRARSGVSYHAICNIFYKYAEFPNFQYTCKVVALKVLICERVGRAMRGVATRSSNETGFYERRPCSQNAVRSVLDRIAHLPACSRPHHAGWFANQRSAGGNSSSGNVPDLCSKIIHGRHCHRVVRSLDVEKAGAVRVSALDQYSCHVLSALSNGSAIFSMDAVVPPCR